MHRLLYEAIDEYDGALAMVMVPAPVHSSCNPTVDPRTQERIQGCWYARLMFAVWIKSPERFGEWDRFMVDEKELQAFGFAKAKADEVADLSSFHVSEPDECLDARIAAGIKLYATASKPAIPSLVVPTGIIHDHLPNKTALLTLLKRLLPASPPEVAAASTKHSSPPAMQKSLLRSAT
jgi:hypothetical protein